MTPPMAFVVYEKALEHGNRFVIPHNDEPVRQACKWLVENGYARWESSGRNVTAVARSCRAGLQLPRRPLYEFDPRGSVYRAWRR